jgi:hypothetical protein
MREACPLRDHGVASKKSHDLKGGQFWVNAVLGECVRGIVRMKGFGSFRIVFDGKDE